jgi:hypothetical protein
MIVRDVILQWAGVLALLLLSLFPVAAATVVDDGLISGDSAQLGTFVSAVLLLETFPGDFGFAKKPQKTMTRTRAETSSARLRQLGMQSKKWTSGGVTRLFTK